MIRMRAVIAGLALTGILLGLAPPLRAEELRQALNAPLILNLLALPSEAPGAASRAMLSEVPAAGSPARWEMLPDGSARFGTPTFHVIVKNPCPGHGPVALPGRTR